MSERITGVVLAKGAPVECQDGRKVMCSIVVSQELGLVRLYPLSITGNVDIRVWSKVSCDARRSEKDHRIESYRVDAIEQNGSVESAQEKSAILDSCVLKSGSNDPIDYQNTNHRSICVVKVRGRLGFALDPREDVEDMDDASTECWILTQNNYPYKPYITWESDQGKKHKTHTLAQEVYMGMKNNTATPSRIFDIMRIGDPDYQHWLVLGNMSNRRNVWVCPHVHRLKKTSFRTVSSCLINDGRNDGWPYLYQEAANVRNADPQRTFNFTT